MLTFALCALYTFMAVWLRGLWATYDVPLRHQWIADFGATFFPLTIFVGWLVERAEKRRIGR